MKKFSLKQFWLNRILHLSSLIYKVKNQIVYAGIIKTIFLGILVIVLEILLSIISLPFYFLIGIDRVTFDFKGGVQAFRLRQRITVGALVAFLGFQVATGIFSFSGATEASSWKWDFSDPAQYTSDSPYLTIKDGKAVFDPTPSLEVTSSKNKKAVSNKTCTAKLEAKQPLAIYNIKSWNAFTQSANVGKGEIYYQLSLNNGLDWIYFDGRSWVRTLSDLYSTRQDINKNISSLSKEDAKVLFRAYFENDCTQVMKLDAVSITYATDDKVEVRPSAPEDEISSQAPPSDQTQNDRPNEEPSESEESTTNSGEANEGNQSSDHSQSDIEPSDEPQNPSDEEQGAAEEQEQMDEDPENIDPTDEAISSQNNESEVQEVKNPDQDLDQDDSLNQSDGNIPDQNPGYQESVDDPNLTNSNQESDPDSDNETIQESDPLNEDVQEDQGSELDQAENNEGENTEAENNETSEVSQNEDDYSETPDDSNDNEDLDAVNEALENETVESEEELLSPVEEESSPDDQQDPTSPSLPNVPTPPTGSGSSSNAGGSGAGGSGGGGSYYSTSNLFSTTPEQNNSVSNSVNNQSSNKNEISETTFSDLEGHWAKPYVEKMQEICHVEGYPDPWDASSRLFKPNQNISRSELVAMILKCNRVSLSNPRQAPFVDVALGVWHTPYIDRAKELDIVSGYPDGFFRPINFASRAEALKIILLSKLSNEDLSRSQPGYGVSDFCRDLDQNVWYAPYFAAALKNKIVTGYTDAYGNPLKECRPQNEITRAEAAKMIINLKEFLQ